MTHVGRSDRELGLVAINGVSRPAREWLDELERLVNAEIMDGFDYCCTSCPAGDFAVMLELIYLARDGLPRVDTE